MSDEYERQKVILDHRATLDHYGSRTVLLDNLSTLPASAGGSCVQVEQDPACLKARFLCGFWYCWKCNWKKKEELSVTKKKNKI